MKKIIEKELGNIEIPKELNKISERGIKKASLEMRRNNINKYIRRVSGVAATFIIAITLIATSNTALANSIKGFFKDITNRNGAVIGTVYDQATEEIDIEMAKGIIKDNEISMKVEVTFKDISKAPYNVIEALTLGDFKIVDSLGNKINFKINDEDKNLVEVNNEDQSKRSFTGNIVINKNNSISSDKYTLIINSFYGHKKADAPIEIKGNWKFDLSIE